MTWSGKAAAAAAAAAAVLMTLAAAGCASGTSGKAAFAGYKWEVTAIAHGGKPTPIPAAEEVYLEFTPNGQFFANEPVNSHSGTYRPAGDGFTTSELAVSAVGSAGGDRAQLLSIAAISAFDDGAHARATVRGDRMTVLVGGYRLSCRRDGQQPDFPAVTYS